MNPFFPFGGGFPEEKLPQLEEVCHACLGDKQVCAECGEARRNCPCEMTPMVVCLNCLEVDHAC